ncbi:LCP family protein [Propionibacterium australiense]|uniref:LytR_cpsA_psr: cell envelope-related function transcriptional attenuator common domain n=1 Tax=Propionibacterium australiense TaxID=119981 RepID=A0A383S4C8_9ACTN|nr:LCP family protein [Propionibacterium australiense]RLP10579.1 transcriptional regulator [Propionibacterium australiense]RLP12875.1 transcriptional regulator [Propionibacterium australiense]SYZ32777.1 lytR_cpsA_psr: cell envelope-related function transcriptional attenuator common domain [Propionibacterium australiense]
MTAPGGLIRRHRVLSSLVALVVLLALLCTITVGVVDRRFGDVALRMPTADGPSTWLILGLDDRTQQAEGTDIGDQDGHRDAAANADVILVATQGDGQWHLTSVRRDVHYQIGRGLSGRLGLAWQDDPQTLVDQVCLTLNIPADHVVAVNLRAFVELVDALGGIDITVQRDMRDERAALEITAGPHHVDGRTALAYVRSRQGQVLIDGTWVDDPEGQDGRARRAGEVFGAITARLKARPGSWAGIGWRIAPDVQLDTGTHLWQLAALAGAADAETRELPLTESPDGFYSEVDAKTRAYTAEIGYTQTCRL